MSDKSSFEFEMPNGQKLIVINSFAHFKIEERGAALVLLEYPEECPSMGDREEFKPEEGIVVACWKKGEKVRFAYWIADEGTFESLASVPIVCGDDFVWDLNRANKEEK